MAEKNKPHGDNGDRDLARDLLASDKPDRVWDCNKGRMVSVVKDGKGGKPAAPKGGKK